MKDVKQLTVAELTAMAERMYGNMVKGVVDVTRARLVLDMEMHVDGEQYMLEHGSAQMNLWGINLYPAKFGRSEFIEFDSMINIRPSQHNRSRTVEDPAIQSVIQKIVDGIVTP